ncbi:MAG: hypothetical protein JSS90_09260 [Bacteroidetes bacterium]|jgi:cytochrome c oxidase subunit 3|nr:hypothetical protein [Bacteroidota bacterium]
MATDRTRSKEKSISISRIEKIHPYKTVLFFGILTSTVILLTFTFLFLTSLSENNLKPPALPKIFTLSTIMLMFSSYTISKTVSAFKKDSFDSLLQSTITTILISSLFILTQVFGLHALYKAGFFSMKPFNSFYFTSLVAFHLAHVLLLTSYLVYITYQAYHRSQDMIDSLLFFSDSNILQKLNSTTILCHYVNFSWLAMFLLFLFSF